MKLYVSPNLKILLLQAKPITSQPKKDPDQEMVSLRPAGTERSTAVDMDKLVSE